MTLIEAPQQLRHEQGHVVPGMRELCAAQHIPIVGNAGGNSQNWSDLSNAPQGPSGRIGALYP